MARYSTVHVDDLEGEGPGGAVRKTRRALGAQAFGFNHFRLPAGATGLEHDETSTNQEEVVVVLRGSGTFRIDGEDVAVREGQFLRLDPAAVRCPTAGADGLEFVTFGAPLGSGYAPPSWG